MNIKWIGSPNFNTGRGSNKITKIVCHWIVGDLAAADAVFLKDSSDVSAHYAVGESEIHQYVKEDDTAWHAGNFAVNQQSIGIEHRGGPNIPITDKVYTLSAELISEISKRHSIPLDRAHIIKHSEVIATACPGTLDIDRLISMAKAMSGSDVKELEAKIGELETQVVELRASRDKWKADFKQEEVDHAKEIQAKVQHIESLQSSLSLANESAAKDKLELTQVRDERDQLKIDNLALVVDVDLKVKKLQECEQGKITLEKEINRLQGILDAQEGTFKTKVKKISWTEFAKIKLGK